MEVQQALDIKKALLTLSEALDLDLQDVATRVCFLDRDREAVLVEASKVWNEFDNAEIVERGAMLGLDITVTE